MARSIVLSNGELAVGLDGYGQVRDVYFPHVGYENHVRGHYVHHLGVWVGGVMSWLDEDPAWQIQVQCKTDVLESVITAANHRLQVELSFNDLVFNERPVFFRRVKVTNLAREEREIRLFFGQQFEIYKSHGGDTAYYDPASHSIVHYKGRRVFQIRAELDGELFSDYAIGIAHFHNKEGAWRDADDGQLSKNPIEHGPADSVIGLYGTYAQGVSRTCHYWMIAERSIELAQELNEYVSRKSPEYLMSTAEDFWRAWTKRHTPLMPEFDQTLVELYQRSLMHARAHVDLAGGTIASLDSDMLQYGLDTYSYVWPRDSAYVALSFTMAGEPAIAKRFFQFAAGVMTHDGYLMHKYLPDSSLGSSWHPWIRDGQLQLPIQEDETALVVYALHQYYLMSGDLELIEMLYEPLVQRTGGFMLLYRDKATGLPDASYDLWEEKRGSSTFSSATVYAALVAAAELSRILGKSENEELFRNGASEVRDAILTHLWDEQAGIFVKLIRPDGTVDHTLDVSSSYAISAYGILPVDDPRVQRAWEATVKRLSFGNEAGGLARYEGDYYYRNSSESAGNPWILTTLWYAEYLIARAKSKTELKRALDIFSWVARHAEPSGVLPEQLDPKTGAPLSATPLAWSHAGYVIAVQKYLARLKELSG